MGFVRNIAGLVITSALAAAISHATDLHLYAFVCLAIQWVVAIAYAIPNQDEKYFDLTGSITFASVSLLALFRTEQRTWRNIMLTAMVWFWCVRLGYFLFTRIRAAGSDSRFEKIRGVPLRFLSVWSVQGLWVFLTLLAVLLHHVHAMRNDTITQYDIVGTSIWLLGYVVEVTADHQKTVFRADPRNKEKFISSGLWAYSRHPNYFGEILMWIGICAVAVHDLPLTFLKGFAALSPVFVTFLLTKVSGIPLLEKQAEEKWGSLASYQEYKARTSVLVLLPQKKQ